MAPKPEKKSPDSLMGKNSNPNCENRQCKRFANNGALRPFFFHEPNPTFTCVNGKEKLV